MHDGDEEKDGAYNDDDDADGGDLKGEGGERDMRWLGEEVR